MVIPVLLQMGIQMQRLVPFDKAPKTAMAPIHNFFSKASKPSVGLSSCSSESVVPASPTSTRLVLQEEPRQVECSTRRTLEGASSAVDAVEDKISIVHGGGDGPCPQPPVRAGPKSNTAGHKLIIPALPFLPTQTKYFREEMAVALPDYVHNGDESNGAPGTLGTNEQDMLCAPGSSRETQEPASAGGGGAMLSESGTSSRGIVIPSSEEVRSLFHLIRLLLLSPCVSTPKVAALL